MLTVDNKKVDQAEYAHSVRTTIGPWMQETGSKLVMADCVTVNRAPEVIDTFKEFGIEVFPSNGKGHYVPGGQAPYSHETNHEDGSMFGTFQDDLTKRMRDLDSVATHTHALLSCTRKSPNSGAPQSITAWL